jgi:hypothetical protein
MFCFKAGVFRGIKVVCSLKYMKPLAWENNQAGNLDLDLYGYSFY